MSTLPRPSLWEIVTGKRDQEIFEGFAAAAIAAGEIREGAKEARKEYRRGRYIESHGPLRGAQLGIQTKKCWHRSEPSRRCPASGSSRTTPGVRS